MMRFDSEGNLLPEIGQAEDLAQEAPPLDATADLSAGASGAISAEQLAEFEAAFSDSPPETSDSNSCQTEHVAPSVPSAVTAVGELSDGAAPLDAPYGYNFLGYPRKHPEPSEAASRQVLMARGFNLSDDECKRLLYNYDNGRPDDPWYDTGGES